MSYETLPFVLALINLFLFVGLGLYALGITQVAQSTSIRMLWRVAILPILAVVLGVLQRLGVHARRVGWLPSEGMELLVDRWQLVSSAVIAIVAVSSFLLMRRLATRLQTVEAVIGNAVNRVSSHSLRNLNLTPREQEVLHAIGATPRIDDQSLAEKLFISPDTVHSHISSLLRKTQLHDRRDLIVVAYVLGSR